MNFEQLAALAQALPEDKRNNALSLLTDMQTVTLSVDDSERPWRAPIFRIIQAMTDTDNLDGDNKSPGRLVVGSTAIAEDHLDIHVLRAWDSRKMWDPDVAVTKIVCNSPDGKTGWRYGDCRSCENSKWVDKTPSPCKQEKSFLVLTNDFRNLIEVVFKSTHLAIGTEWQSQLKKSSRPAYQRVFTLNSVKSEQKKGVFNPKITRTDQYAEGAEDQFLEGLFMYLRGQRTAQIENFYESIKKYRDDQLAKQAQEEAEEQTVTIRGGDAGVEQLADNEQLPNYSL